MVLILGVGFQASAEIAMSMTPHLPMYKDIRIFVCELVHQGRSEVLNTRIRSGRHLLLCEHRDCEACPVGLWRSGPLQRDDVVASAEKS